MPTIEPVLIYAVNPDHPSYFTSEEGWCWAKIVLNYAGKVDAIYLTKADEKTNNIPKDDCYDHAFLFERDQLANLDFILISYEERMSAYMRIQQNRTLSRLRFELDLKYQFITTYWVEKASIKQHTVRWSAGYYAFNAYDLSREEVQHNTPREIFKEETGLPYEYHYEDFLQQQATETLVLDITIPPTQQRCLPHANCVEDAKRTNFRYGHNSIFNEAHSHHAIMLTEVDVVETSASCIIM